jgi:hypothetical protein
MGDLGIIVVPGVTARQTVAAEMDNGGNHSREMKSVVSLTL